MHIKPHSGIIGQIGNTPLIQLDLPYQAKIFAKLEWLNPGGSIKDRTALHMLSVAEQQGKLQPGSTIIEASSGNQGIALAMLGAIKGYRVIITTCETMSQEKLAMLKAYGAEVILCPEVDDFEDPCGKGPKAKQLLQEIPNSFSPDQFYNPENLQAHYLSTGPEIWQQTQGQVTHCFMGMGTCGTITGVGRYLKEQNPAIKIIGIDAATSRYSAPDNPKAYKTEGIGIDVISDILDLTIIDEIIPMADDDAFATTRKFSRQGLLIGLSSGAVMYALEQYAFKLTTDHTVVVIFPDSGRAYLSKL